MAKLTGGKCPKCSRRFPHTKAGNKAFQKHFAKMHYKPKKAADPTRPFKVPGFAKGRKK